jgi:hypothetical protein
MSAVYLHNSIYTRESLQGRANVPPHSRNLSTVSSVTVQTDSTFHSHPTEPLLPPSNSSRDTYFGGPTRETGGSRVDVASPSIPNHPWASPNLTEENTFVETEKPTHWKPARRRASKRWSWARIAFEIAIGEYTGCSSYYLCPAGFVARCARPPDMSRSGIERGCNGIHHMICTALYGVSSLLGSHFVKMSRSNMFLLFQVDGPFTMPFDIFYRSRCSNPMLDRRPPLH